MANAPGNSQYYQGTVNSDGTYSIASLPDSTTYRVQVTGASFLTSVSYQSVPISGADVSGINFAAVAASAAGVFTPTFSDSFQRAPEIPLSDGGLWKPISGEVLPARDVLQILNDVCTTTVLTATSDGTSYVYIGAGGATIPQDHFCQAEIADLASNGNFIMYVRVGNGTSQTGNMSPQYALDIYEGIGFLIYAVDSNGANSPYTWVGFQPQTFSIGDVLAFAIAGQNDGILYVFQNEVCIWQGAINPNPDFAMMTTSGTVGLTCSSFGSPQLPTDIGLIDFEAGAFSVQPLKRTRGTRSK